VRAAWCRRIILLEISELLLLTIEGELRRSFPDVEIEAVLGDCGDPAVIRHALSLHRSIPLPCGRLQACTGAGTPAA
jgi:FlaA1/EpsC-like NDP-sugar epimerase